MGNVPLHEDPEMEKTLSKRRYCEAHIALKRFVDAHRLAQHNPCQELKTPNSYGPPSTDPNPIILLDKGWHCWGTFYP